LVVIAIGGNSLIRDRQHQSVDDQYVTICETVCHIVDIIEDGFKVVISHGNGPQVGFILRRSEIAYLHEGLHFVPLASCVADTQGALGYQIQQALENEFRKRNLAKMAVTVITRVEVNPDDPSFAQPDKPIGSFYSHQQIQNLKKDHSEWAVIHDAGRGYRRAVPSPVPIRIVEIDAIKALIKQNFCVVAAGGGGIPVTRLKDGSLEGCDAVIDKDLTSSLLAAQLKAEMLLICTAVDNVFLNFGKVDQKALDVIRINEARRFIDAGHFSVGSMLPKINAALDFLEGGGASVIITSPKLLKAAIRGNAGTRVYR
jgi:carbamate kinase